MNSKQCWVKIWLQPYQQLLGTKLCISFRYHHQNTWRLGFWVQVRCDIYSYCPRKKPLACSLLHSKWASTALVLVLKTYTCTHACMNRDPEDGVLLVRGRPQHPYLVHCDVNVTRSDMWMHVTCVWSCRVHVFRSLICHAANISQVKPLGELKIDSSTQGFILNSGVIRSDLTPMLEWYPDPRHGMQESRHCLRLRDWSKCTCNYGHIRILSYLCGERNYDVPDQHFHAFRDDSSSLPCALNLWVDSRSIMVVEHVTIGIWNWGHIITIKWVEKAMECLKDYLYLPKG